MSKIGKRELAQMIDHTFLKAAGDADAVEKLCREAVEHGFACVMVNPAEILPAKKYLQGSDIRIGTVIGFPLGQSTKRMKFAEALDAVMLGARDIDYVINVRLLKQSVRDGETSEAAEELRDEMRKMVSVRQQAEGVVTKLIIECCYLTDEEKIFACKMAKEVGFDFVKTSTGFGTGGATAADVRLMRETVGEDMGVKAAGGIRDLKTALEMIAAGANRIGCSAGVEIVSAL